MGDGVLGTILSQFGESWEMVNLQIRGRQGEMTSFSIN